MEIDYAELLPKKPPTDIVSIALKDGAFKKEYLIYRAGWDYSPMEDRKIPAVEVVCSHCQRRFIADKVDAGCCSHRMPAPFGFFHPTLKEAVCSGSDSICPFCGCEAEVAHVGNINRFICDYAYVTQAVRIPVAGRPDRFALVEWQISREIGKGGDTRFFTSLWTAWVVEDRKMIRCKGYSKFMSSLSLRQPYQLKTFLDDYGQLHHMYPFHLEDLEDTTAENCKLDLFIAQGGTSLVAYLALWRRHPNVENLIMQGCGKLVQELIDKESATNSYSRAKGIPKLPMIDWKKKKPHEMLHLGKEEFRDMGKTLTEMDITIIGLLRSRGVAVNLKQDLPILRRQNRYSVQSILDFAGSRLFWKAMAYLDNHQEGYMMLRDYWDMANQVEMDLNNDRVRWPKNLKKAHDDAMERYNTKKDALLEKSFAKRLEILSQLEWHCDGILIRPCATQAEMRKEGKILNHCVARYAKDHAAGKTAIFLIRQEAEPDKPWFTLELDEKNMRVLQNRGKYNCARTPEVEAFEKKWLEHITERRKTA